MKNPSLNYEEKIIAPTKELYQQLNLQVNELFQNMAVSANELHSRVAEMGLELYNNPSETASRWQVELTGKGNEIYAHAINDVMPAVKADYQHWVSVTTDYGTQLQMSVQYFMDNPELVTADAFNALNQGLMHFFEVSKNVSAQVLDDIRVQASEIIELLIDSPMQAMEGIYYDSLSGLLNSYFEVVSSLLVSL
ncbi:MAG: hypothetical protein GQ583_09120 [Methyloprofundus sp.]|nr:hypothetical protein [Methyloprofundus sp.]